MNELALLEYMFLFEPLTTWSHGYQFEQSLAEFFAAYGFSVQVVDVRGGSDKRAFYITKLEEVPLPQISSPQPTLNQMRVHKPSSGERQFKKETFNK